MLIISKEKDYYEIATTIDKTLVWERHTEVFKGFDKSTNTKWNDYSGQKYHLDSNGRENYGDQFELFVIGFCGKQYVGYIDNSHLVTNGGQAKRSRSYSGLDRVIDGTITYDKGKILKVYTDHLNKTDRSASWMKNRLLATIDMIERIHGKEDDTLFLKYNTPVYVISETWKYGNDKTFIKDAILDDLDFISVIDPYTAFQELSMYLGDRLRFRDKDLIEISDKDKIASHGYDPKMSFRKDQHQSKPRRKKK